VTCVSLIKDDVINAGGNYVDEPVVRDRNIITSRLPSDLPDFAREIVRYLREAPMRRNAARKLSPSKGRAYSSAAFDKPVQLAMGPRGKASANYITVVVDAS
jgi:protease I